MESNKINWYNDYVLNEAISGYTNDLMIIYGRIFFDYPTHPDAQSWKAEAELWNEKRLALPDLFFGTESEAKEYSKHLYNLRSEALRLEGMLKLTK